MDLLGSTQNPAGTILGETVGPTAQYIRLTRAGDANLDGVVNFDDLLSLAQNYGRSADWYRGDFNYNGAVNFDDLLILAQNYNGAMPGAPWSIDSPGVGYEPALAAAFAAAVPEPGVIGAAAAFFAAAGMRRRRRRGVGR
jgi:hypothetical protein